MIARIRAGLERYAIVRFAAALAREIEDHDIPGMAAEMAYRFLFAIFPLLLLTAAVVGLIGAAMGRDGLVLEVAARLATFLPSSIAATLAETLGRLVTDQAATYATIGLLASLWGAAGGLGALMKGLDRAYDVAPSRATWRRQLVAIGATLVVPPLGLVLLILSVLGHGLTSWLGAALGVGDALAGAVAIAQAVLAFVIVLAGMAVMYRVLPVIRQRSRDVIPGALVATLGWTVLTQAFGAYVARLGGQEAAYGALGAAIAFLLWLYLVGVIVLVGAEVNALLSPSGRAAWAARPAVAAG